MMSWLRRLCVLVLGLFSSRAALAAPPKPLVVVYDGWGTPTSFVLKGRVLQSQDEAKVTKERGGLRNLIENAKALESDEIPRLPVVVHVHNRDYAATTDEDGVFVVQVKGLAGASLLPVGAVPCTVRIADNAMSTAGVGEAVIFVLNDISATRVLVSDIDDTVVKTYVTSKVKMLGEVLLKNEAQLEPVVGAAANYTKAVETRQIQQVIYLSGSPQNFHIRLQGFLKDHGFPRGPILLKNIGDDSMTKQGNYKLSRLEAFASFFPKIRFVLIGDSGEHDPEIYQEFRAKYPDRVDAIFIRAVDGGDNSAARLGTVITIPDAGYANADVVTNTLKD
jgi:phosphatidate phosphatase APP1